MVYGQLFDMHGNPMYYTVAIKTDVDHWKPAMEEEMKSLHEHNVWNLINLPEGRDTIKCKWVYFIKRNTDNLPTRYKAWLVTKGFSQVYGIDYKETFAPVARLDSLRLLLNLTAIFDWEVHQFNIKTTYLHGDLEEEIYMD
jgi:Reverse transcriptase (RNA-dependent DNA polymerase)